MVLALSGHDPSGAAGVQADIETLARGGCHCVSVITSLTAQNTAQFKHITPQPPALFREQLDLLTQDLSVDACKIGLIGSVELVEVIADYLARTNFPVVLDPILASGTGAGLASAALRAALTEQLFPHATIVTPNLAEALTLTGGNELNSALYTLLERGCDTALVTTSDDEGGRLTNTWMDETRALHKYHWDKLPGTYHGSGCTLSAGIAGWLAQGTPLRTAVAQAQEYTWQTLHHARRHGTAQLHPERFF